MTDVDVSYTDEERTYWHGRHNDRPMDLGHGIRAQLFTLHADRESDPAGLIISHIHDDDQVCEGSLHFDTEKVRAAGTNGPRWRVESYDPLTIHPSVRIRPCGLHGWIRHGRWFPA